MYADPSIVHINLEDWQWDMVEAEAAACDMSVSDLLHEMLVEQARIELGEDVEAIGVLS
jgi:hypothetical protein